MAMANDKPGKPAKDCPYCHGIGWVRENGRYPNPTERCRMHDPKVIGLGKWPKSPY